MKREVSKQAESLKISGSFSAQTTSTEKLGECSKIIQQLLLYSGIPRMIVVLLPIKSVKENLRKQMGIIKKFIMWLIVKQEVHWEVVGIVLGFPVPEPRKKLEKFNMANFLWGITSTIPVPILHLIRKMTLSFINIPTKLLCQIVIKLVASHMRWTQVCVYRIKMNKMAIVLRQREK